MIPLSPLGRAKRGVEPERGVFEFTTLTLTLSLEGRGDKECFPF